MIQTFQKVCNSCAQQLSAKNEIVITAVSLYNSTIETFLMCDQCYAKLVELAPPKEITERRRQ